MQNQFRIIFIFILSFIFLGLLKAQKLSDNYEYDIDLVYDSLNRQFSGDLTLHFEQLSKDISELPFTFLIDSTNNQSLEIWINGNECKYIIANKFDNGLNGFKIELGQSHLKEHNIIVHIKFKTIAHGDYFNKNQILFNGPWIPMLQYYENGRFLQHYQKHSDYKVTITYPSDFIVATSGLVVKSSIKHDNIIIQTKAKDIPSYGLVMSREFIVKETRSRDGILIRSIYYDYDIKWGEKLLEMAEDVINFYIDTIGFYPQPILTIIPGANNPYGGWPVSPNIVCIHRGLDKKGDNAITHATWITAHEIGHQYWGYNYVLEPLNYPEWFGISMGIYTDWLYSNSRKVNNDYYGFFDSYIQGFKKGYNTTVTQTLDTLNQQNFDWNNVIKHGKSFAILRMLAYEIGEDKFFEIFNYCLANYKGVNVTLDLFQQTCENVTNADLYWFFNQWYKTNYHLDYEIINVNSKFENQAYITECQLLRKGNAVVSSIEIGFKQNTGEIIIKAIDGKDLTMDIIVETKNPVESIIIDPNKKYPLINKKESLLST